MKLDISDQTCQRTDLGNDYSCQHISGVWRDLCGQKSEGVVNDSGWEGYCGYEVVGQESHYSL